MRHTAGSRRHFLKSCAGIAGAAFVLPRVPWGSTALAGPLEGRSAVSLVSGEDHVDNVFQALQPFKREIAAAIGSRPILLKPNNVIGTPDNGHGDVLLSDTPVESLEGILEFLKSIGKTDITIAEACATDPTMLAFANCNYFSLARKYPVRFKDLNQEGYVAMRVYYGGRGVSQPTSSIRISKVLTDPNWFVISSPKPKTHNNVVATVSLKCVAMASPIVDPGSFRGIGNAVSDKGTMHGAGNQDLNDNLRLLAPLLAPDLAVVDGYVGMQGNGPCWGTAVNHRFAAASLDWLAADRVTVELMGIDSSYPAYLNYCHQGGLGQYDLTQIDVLGPSIGSKQIVYEPNNNWSGQLGMAARERP